MDYSMDHPVAFEQWVAYDANLVTFVIYCAILDAEFLRAYDPEPKALIVT